MLSIESIHFLSDSVQWFPTRIFVVSNPNASKADGWIPSIEEKTFDTLAQLSPAKLWLGKVALIFSSSILDDPLRELRLHIVLHGSRVSKKGSFLAEKKHHEMSL